MCFRQSLFPQDELLEQYWSSPLLFSATIRSPVWCGSLVCSPVCSEVASPGDWNNSGHVTSGCVWHQCPRWPKQWKAVKSHLYSTTWIHVSQPGKRQKKTLKTQPPITETQVNVVTWPLTHDLCVWWHEVGNFLLLWTLKIHTGLIRQTTTNITNHWTLQTFPSAPAALCVHC